MAKSGTRRFAYLSLTRAANAIGKAAYYLRRVAVEAEGVHTELANALEELASECDVLVSLIGDLADSI